MTHLAERIHQLHPGPMKALDASNTRIVTGGADGAVRLLAGNGEHLAASTAHHDLVNDVSLAPDGKIVSASRDRTVRLFDPDVGRSYVIGEHDHWVMAVTWSDDGTRVASGSEDGTVGIWAPEGASVTRVSLGRPVNGIDWRGGIIAAVTGDGKLHLLTADGATVRQVEGASQIPWDVALSPAADRAAWAGRDRMLRITTVKTGETVAVPAHTDQIWGVAWDATGDRVLSVAADGTCAIWTPLGEGIERIDVGTWLRRGRFRGVELYLATEEGGLAIYSSDGLPATVPTPIEIPAQPDTCSHWDPRVEDAGTRPRCQECGSREEARLCVTCGHVGCCESQLAHATKHWIETGHPNTIPVPTRDFGWRWCYADDMYVKRVSGSGQNQTTT